MNNNWFEIITGIIGVFGVLFALFEYYRRRKLSQVLRTIMQTYPGDLAKIEQSCTWAWHHSRGGVTDAAKLPDCPEKYSVVEHLNLATGDSAAAARMCHVLFNQLMGFQQAQFGSRIIIHGERDSLDLTKQELKSQSSN